MKKFLAAAAVAILAFAFTACGEDAGESQVTLTIQNQTFSEIIDVVWSGVPFGWISPGGTASRDVAPGTAFINFERLEHSLLARTTNPVSVGGSPVTFVFMNETEITSTDPDTLGNTGRFDTLAVGLSIGSLGPGGGRIFFVQGGQYMEVSGELGSDGWQNADAAVRNFRGGGFSDWTLPTRAQLDLLFQHKNAVGGFLNARYWSSELELAPFWYWTLNFANNSWAGRYRDDSYRFRAVRTFSQ